VILVDPTLEYIISVNDRGVGSLFKEGSRDRFAHLRLAHNAKIKATDLGMYKKVIVVWDHNVYIYNKDTRQFDKYVPTQEEMYLIFEGLV
jgi:hypothetical protein